MYYCRYYQALVEQDVCWYLTAILRSYEHLAFDRTLDVSESRFEFFVPHDLNDDFVQLMQHMTEEGVVTGLQEYDNRLIDPDALV